MNDFSLTTVVSAEFIVMLRRVKAQALSADGTGSCLSDEDSRREETRIAVGALHPAS